jgi:hypothetical protein
MTSDLRCTGCSGHEHRLGPLADCALLDCTCAFFEPPSSRDANACLDCNGSGYASGLDGSDLGICFSCNGEGVSG